jgi:peptidylprolyl isomerase
VKIKVIILLFVFVLTAAGLLAAYVFMENSTDTRDMVTSEPESNSVQGLQTEQPQQAQNSLRVDNGNTEQNTPSLPGPDQFSVYEQYATDTTSSYIDVTIGEGPEAVAGDTVAVLYSGHLTDGTLFDQSRPNENNEIQPFIFTLGSGQVIPGWEQTITGMKTGGQRRLIIPSELGYGASGQGTIPADSMLIFDVQLVGIQ